MSWHIEAEPEGKNDGKNEGGMVIRLTNGSSTQEVSRVGFVRRHSANPHVSYERQLAIEVGKARASANLLNESVTGDGSLL